MFKVLLVYSICAVIVCRSATLQETLQTAMSDIIVNGINMSLSRLKEEYQQKIRQLKTEATSCVIGGSCSDILRKIEVSHCNYYSKLEYLEITMKIYRFVQQNLKKGFYQDADQLKNSEMRTMQTYQRQINIRCIDCIADYIDDIFSDFCDEMDEELAPNGEIEYNCERKRIQCENPSSQRRNSKYSFSISIDL